MTIVSTSVLRTEIPPASDPTLQKLMRDVIASVKTDAEELSMAGLYKLIEICFEAGATTGDKIAKQMATEIAPIIEARMKRDDVLLHAAVDSFIARRSRIVPITPPSASKH